MLKICQTFGCTPVLSYFVFSDSRFTQLQFALPHRMQMCSPSLAFASDDVKLGVWTRHFDQKTFKILCEVEWDKTICTSSKWMTIDGLIHSQWIIILRSNGSVSFSCYRQCVIMYRFTRESWRGQIHVVRESPASSNRQTLYRQSFHSASTPMGVVLRLLSRSLMV